MACKRLLKKAAGNLESKEEKLTSRLKAHDRTLASRPDCCPFRGCDPSFVEKDLPSHHVICFSLLNSLHLLAIKMATKTKNFAALGPESQVSLPLFAGARKLGFLK